jgi:hypothetical protein
MFIVQATGQNILARTFLQLSVRVGSTVVEHSTRKPKIEGSNLTTGREKMAKKLSLEFWILGAFTIKLFTAVIYGFL